MKYRRKPTEIEAVQWDGSDDAEFEIEMMEAEFEWIAPEFMGHLLAGKGGAQGWVDVPVGHWVAKADDDYYPIDPDVFAATYEPVE